MLVGRIAGITPGDYVLDMCAAPGGKSLHCADILSYCEKYNPADNKGHIEDCDISEYKTELINENIIRSGFNNITAVVADATIYNEELFEKADVVIADIPCSGLGIIGRKPDIKYNKEDNFEELTVIQRKILHNAANYLKVGGKLLYSTCTLNKLENRENVDAFLNEHKGFVLEEDYTFSPQNDKSDGFYAAIISKKEV